MTVTVEDLINQLSEDESREKQLEIYFNAATKWIKNAVSSEQSDDAFFSSTGASELADLAILSYAMELWTHRSETMPPSTAVGHLVGQLRGLFASWKEEQDEEIQT